MFKWTSPTTETELGGGPFNDGVEFSTMTGTTMTWVGNPTDTSFAENDRLVLILYITNIGTMGSGTCTLYFNGTTAAYGDSWLNLNETVTFKSETVKNNVLNIITNTD